MGDRGASRGAPIPNVTPLLLHGRPEYVTLHHQQHPSQEYVETYLQISKVLKHKDLCKLISLCIKADLESPGYRCLLAVCYLAKKPNKLIDLHRMKLRVA